MNQLSKKTQRMNEGQKGEKTFSKLISQPLSWQDIFLVLGGFLGGTVGTFLLLIGAFWFFEVFLEPFVHSVYIWLTPVIISIVLFFVSLFLARKWRMVALVFFITWIPVLILTSYAYISVYFFACC